MIDYVKLKERCNAEIEDFFNEGEVKQTVNGVYIYKDNGASILAVAHLDMVNELKHFIIAGEGKVTVDKSIITVRPKSNNGTVVLSTALDDRLGAYLILDLLPQLGMKYDILLTEGEESGRSTAQYFEPPKGKKYRWMFSFDRSGTDVVMYEYETDKAVDRLRGVGFDVGIGSFSDICYLDHLKCTGFNFGTAYYANHAVHSHFIPEELEMMIKKFQKFWNKYRQMGMPWTRSQYRSKWWRRYAGNYYYNAYSYDNAYDSTWDTWSRSTPARTTRNTFEESKEERELLRHSRGYFVYEPQYFKPSFNYRCQRCKSILAPQDDSGPLLMHKDYSIYYCKSCTTWYVYGADRALLLVPLENSVGGIPVLYNWHGRENTHDTHRLCPNCKNVPVYTHTHLNGLCKKCGQWFLIGSSLFFPVNPNDYNRFGKNAYDDPRETHKTETQPHLLTDGKTRKVEECTFCAGNLVAISATMLACETCAALHEYRKFGDRYVLAPYKGVYGHMGICTLCQEEVPTADMLFSNELGEEICPQCFNEYDLVAVCPNCGDFVYTTDRGKCPVCKKKFI